MGTGKFRQLVPSPETRSFVLTFSHPDLPRSKSAGTGHATAAPTCRLGTGLTVGSGLAPRSNLPAHAFRPGRAAGKLDRGAPDPPRPFARPRVAGSPFHRNGITAGRESTPKGLTLPRRSRYAVFSSHASTRWDWKSITS